MSEGAVLRLSRGSLYLSRDVCDRYFHGLESVILVRRGDDLLVMPVMRAAAGGYLLKRRNAAGDRVVSAPDFFREHGLDDRVDSELNADWVAESAALTARDAFRL